MTADRKGTMFQSTCTGKCIGEEDGAMVLPCCFTLLSHIVDNTVLEKDIRNVQSCPPGVHLGLGLFGVLGKLLGKWVVGTGKNEVAGP